MHTSPFAITKPVSISHRSLTPQSRAVQPSWKDGSWEAYKTCLLHPSWKLCLLSLFFSPGCPYIHLFSTASFALLSLLFISYTVSTDSCFSGSLGVWKSRCHLVIRCRKKCHREWVGLIHHSTMSLPDGCAAPLVWAAGSGERSMLPPQMLSAVGHIHDLVASQSKGRFALT